MDTVVLGAGIAGLGYLNSHAACENIRVYEKDSRLGAVKIFYGKRVYIRFRSASVLYGIRSSARTV